jgi:hypothetical protein
MLDIRSTQGHFKIRWRIGLGLTEKNLKTGSRYAREASWHLRRHIRGTCGIAEIELPASIFNNIAADYFYI